MDTYRMTVRFGTGLKDYTIEAESREEAREKGQVILDSAEYADVDVSHVTLKRMAK